MIRRLAVITFVLVALLVACGIPDSGNVARIPSNKIGALDDALPTTSTSTTTPATIEPTTTTIVAEVTTTTIATEDVTLYFISGGILVPFTRGLRKGASSSEVLSALQEGPPAGDIGVGLRTAVPTQDQAPLKVSEDGSGVATVDLPLNFYDTVNQEDQRLAIGQIVLTLTEVGRIGQVRFTLGSQPIGVFRGSGDLSQPGEPLPPRDYLELLESPVDTTTTTSTTTTTTVSLTTPTTVV
jgi:spore germination protein GerM